MVTKDYITRAFSGLDTAFANLRVDIAIADQIGDAATVATKLAEIKAIRDKKVALYDALIARGQQLKFYRRLVPDDEEVTDVKYFPGDRIRAAQAHINNLRAATDAQLMDLTIKF